MDFCSKHGPYATFCRDCDYDVPATITTPSTVASKLTEARRTCESEGPKCPCCGRQYTADDPIYYDEWNYTEETCDECGVTFDVRVYTSTTWTCIERKDALLQHKDEANG